MNWFGVKVLFVYDTKDEAISEFVDDGFLVDWRGMEESVFIVQAASFDDAGERITAASARKRLVNIYGQAIEKSLAAIIDIYSIAEWEMAPREDEEIVEVYSNIVNETTACTPADFIARCFRSSESPFDMLRDISLYEHRPRYEELRGPLPDEDVT